MKKRVLTAFMAAVVALSAVGCASSDADTSSEGAAETTANNAGVGGLKNAAAADKVSDSEEAILVTGDDYPLTVRDYLKYETTIETKPEKVAVLSGTPLNIWYDLGGKSVCTSDVSDNVRLTEGYEEEIKSLPQIGPVYSVDMEAVIAQEPDLIIAQVGTQTTQGSKLREMGYNVIQSHIRGFSDVVDTYRAFGKLLGQSELAEQRIAELEKGKKEITDKLPDDDISVVILYVTSKSLAVKLDNSIAGDIAGILELDNIASGLAPDTVGSETTPLDIEYIVEKDPDYVLVTTMISSNEEAKKTVEEQFASNPAWSSVNAISEGRVIYLPQQYYLYNAGPYYVDAIKYMAQSIYPDIYGEVEETF
jgi:iron complex transport system substrate-binding protein